MAHRTVTSKPRTGLTRDCIDPWDLIFVQASGDVALCCWSRPVGNLKDASLAQIVDGDAARKLREGLLAGELDADCRDCPARGLTSLAQLEQRVHAAIKRREELDELARWRKRARDYQRERDHLEKHADVLAKDLAHVQKHLSNVEAERAELERHADNVEALFGELVEKREKELPARLKRALLRLIGSRPKPAAPAVARKRSKPK